MRKKVVHAVLAFLLASAAGVARAAPACTGLAAGTLAFGAYDPLATAPRDATTTISYRCAASLHPVVSLGAGGGTYAARVLRGPGGDSLGYGLYTTALRDVVWGNGTSGSVTVAVDVRARQVVVYGRLFAQQDARVGGYADTIIVTFDF